MFEGFTIIKRPSIYTNKTVLNEYIPNNRLNALIQHSIGIEYDIDHYQRKHYKFANEMDCYHKLLTKYNRKENCFKIKLKNSPYGWGRVQAEDHSTLSVFHRPTRHSLCQNQYIDLDIKSCCQTIFWNLVKNNGLLEEYPRLNDYVTNRDVLLSTYMDKYAVSKDCIKQLFTSLGFGGYATSWYTKNGISEEPDVFIAGLNTEFLKLADIIYDANKNICDDILKTNPTKFAKYVNPSDLLSKKKRTTMSLVYQTAERYAQETAIDYLCQTKGFHMKDIVPCQDGFMILAPLFYPDICTDCHTIIKGVLKMDLQFVVKEFDERFDIPPYISEVDKTKLEKEQLRIQRQSEKEQLRIQQQSEKDQLKVQKQADKEKKLVEEAIRKNQLRYQKQLEIDATKETKEQEKHRKTQEIKDTFLQKQKDNMDKTLVKYKTEEGIKLPSGHFLDSSRSSSWLYEGVFTDKECADKIYELYPYWVTCNTDLWVFDFTTGMYSNNSIIHNTIITAHTDFIHLMVKDEHQSPEAKDKEWFRSETKSYGNTSILLDKVITFLKTKNVNNDWMKQTQASSLGKILFTNGWYDFETRMFDEYFNPEIVFFGRIHHPFNNLGPMSEEDVIYMDDIKQRLFYETMGTEVGDYFILQLARGLSGECMKRMLFAIGNTNCGKGVITTAISMSIGDYFGSFNAESLAHRTSSNDEAQIMRWVMLLKYKRIIISNEMKSGMVLNGNFLKKICSGGDELTGRTHCKEETAFVTHFLPIILDNDMAMISPYDNATDSRVRCITFPKEFVPYEPTNEFELPMDPHIKDELKTKRFQNCFIMMLLYAHATYTENGKVDYEPEGVRNSKKDLVENVMDNNPVITLLRDYEITNDETDYITSASLQQWLDDKKMRISMTKLGRDLNRHASINKLTNCQASIKKIKGKTVRVWCGIKLIKEEDEEEAGFLGTL
jgi:hypothetical protein